MRITVVFETDNSAFDGADFYPEVRRVFKQARKKVQQLRERRPVLCSAPEAADLLKDSNGNTVGTVKIEREY